MPHISYSELKNWTECTWRHKLLYIDKVQTFQGTEHTCFGTAVHETIENMLLGNITEPYEHFHRIFTEQLEEIGLTEDSELASEMRKQVNGIFELVEPSLDEYFADKGGWTLVATEEVLKEPITESRVPGYDFKGFIDKDTTTLSIGRLVRGVGTLEKRQTYSMSGSLYCTSIIIPRS